MTRSHPSRLILAPMEGVIDHHVRALLTAINPFDYCVTEFVRVTQHAIPAKVFLRLCPELLTNGCTPSQTPVRIQLLGQHPELLAESAKRALTMGSYGIDLNCGCPAKTVVGHQGGAFLLTHPRLIHDITAAIRKAVGANAIVSVKIRLGWEDKSQAFEIADAIQSAGATEIAVHGRTKLDGYQADKIDWGMIGQISERLTIPVIANGEIFSAEDAQRCMQQAQTSSLMLGRGILAKPNLADHIAHETPLLPWIDILNLLADYSVTPSPNDKPIYHSARIKQWLSYLKSAYPQAPDTLRAIRQCTSQAEIQRGLMQQLEMAQR